jgi:hypothetical protein
MNMAPPRSTAEGLTIAQVAELTGVAATTLRVWELRTGWPCPGRHPINGYRVYAAYFVPEIIRVAALMRAGHLLKDIIVDGFPHWPDYEPTIAPPSWSCFDQLPMSKTTAGEAFRLPLVAWVRGRDVARIVLAVHEAVIVLRPGDRLIAAWLPAYFGAREWKRAGRPLERDVGAAIARVAGPVVLADVAARWDTAEAIG